MVAVDPPRAPGDFYNIPSVRAFSDTRPFP
jgi:hypothetical protein